MARAQGARAQMALAFETVYGTSPATGYVKIPFASATLGAEQPLLNSELLGYGRDPLAPIKDALTADGNVVVPIDARAFGYWLKATFGDPITTGAAAPYRGTSEPAEVLFKISGSQGRDLCSLLCADGPCVRRFCSQAELTQFTKFAPRLGRGAVFVFVINDPWVCVHGQRKILSQR